MNKTLINPLNLLHEIIPVFTTMHCTLPVLNNKKVQGKKNYIYIYRNLERERREAREMDGYMGEFFFFILTCVIRSWSLYYFVLAFTASVVLLKVCHKKKASVKGQKINSNHTCLRRPCGGIVLPSIIFLQPFSPSRNKYEKRELHKFPRFRTRCSTCFTLCLLRYENLNSFVEFYF